MYHIYLLASGRSTCAQQAQLQQLHSSMLQYQPAWKDESAKLDYKLITPLRSIALAVLPQS